MKTCDQIVLPIHRLGRALRFAAFLPVLALLLILSTGCGAVTMRHVPKLAKISPAKMSDLHGTPPLNLQAGTASTNEVTIGTVGMGKVVGKMSEWTEVVVAAVRDNLTSRGATLTAGAAKTLTITISTAEVKSIPVLGGSKSRVILSATAPEGLNTTIEGADASSAPLGSVDGAATDAIKKLVADPGMDAYLRK